MSGWHAMKKAPKHALEKEPDMPQTSVPFDPSARHIPDYYKAKREVTRGGKVMISADADPADVIFAFGIRSHAMGELVAKALRMYRKPGTDVEKEHYKLMEHAMQDLEEWRQRQAEKGLV